MDILFKKLNADITPEVLAQIEASTLLLESAGTNEQKGRYSIVAFAPYGQVVLEDEALQIITPEGVQRVEQSPFATLDEWINAFKVDFLPEALAHLPFVSGLIGFCSFDLIRHTVELLAEIEVEGKYPDAVFSMVESVFLFDHYKEELFLIASNLFSGRTQEALAQQLEQMQAQLRSLKLFQPPLPAPERGEVECNLSEQAFIEEVRYFQSLIAKGDMFQVVPSRIYSYAHHFPMAQAGVLKRQLYRNLKRQNPSPYLYYLESEFGTIIGSSPESFIKKIGRTITTNPIAGTIARGHTEAEDARNAEKLLGDEKELAEHRMLVDLGRNDINRVAKAGSVVVSRLMQIERFEHVMHIVSVVEGELEASISPLQLIVSMLPAGTVSGAPKIRAMQRIYQTRQQKRGIYAGGVGYINCNHDLDFALTIRTMVVDEQRVSVEAGCGVVYDSQAEKELQETKIKARSLLEVSP